MTGAFNMHVLKIARNSCKRLYSQLSKHTATNNSIWIAWWMHKKTCPSEQTQKASSTNGFRHHLLCIVNAVLLFWSLCDSTWLFALNEMAHLFDQDDTKTDQASQILNIPGHIKHSRRRFVQTQRSYEWKRHLYLGTISEHMQNKTFHKNFKIKAQMYQMKCICRITKLTIPQTVTLLYLYVFIFWESKQKSLTYNSSCKSYQLYMAADLFINTANKMFVHKKD